MDALTQDLRYALRALSKSPGFTIVALATLALGIGANTAIFSIVDGILLAPLPYERPEELVWVSETSNRGTPMSVAFPNYVDWRAQSTSFAGLALANAFTTTVLGGEEPVPATLATVGEDYWTVFPARPLQGRLTTAPDHLPGSQPVAVVSRSFWQNELGGRALDAYTLEVVGQRVRVVGVVPDGIGYPAGAQVWVPAEPQNSSDSRTAHNWSVVGRLRPRVSVERARQEVDAIMKRIAAASEEQGDFLAVGATTVPLVDEVVGDVRRPLYLLLGAAALVLLVACTNLASTLLARGTARDRELAVRVSLGAARSRIARQLLTESLLLSLLGGALGVVIAYAVVQGVRAAGPAFLPRLSEVGIDAGVIGYTALVSILTALLFGLLPARRLSRADAGDALRSGSRGNAMNARSAVWKALVGAEVALALVLVIGSALLVRSFQTIVAQDAGFDAQDVAVIPMSLSHIRYADGAAHARFYESFLVELESVPGVAAVGVMSSVPLAGSLPNGRLELDGDLEKQAVGGYVVASPGTFDALDIPLLQGRLFDERDRSDGQHVAVVSRSFADEFWPGEDPIGRSVTGGGMDDYYADRIFARVIGVVGDVRHRDLTRDVYPTVYFSPLQRPFRLRFSASVVVEAADGEPAALAPVLGDRLRRADPDVPVRIQTMASLVGETLGERRFVMFVLGGFSLVAAILAAVGIFGVVSYAVVQRTREMGIRMALGAVPASVMYMVMGASLRIIGAGLIVGLGGALLATRTLQAMLYEVSPTDPAALLAAVALLAGIGFVATWLPARAATRVDPMVTMRSE
jgi:predicted permease